jgi:hypothetical protein
MPWDLFQNGALVMAYGKIHDVEDIWYSESGLRIGTQLNSLRNMRLDHTSKTSPRNLYYLLCMSRHAIATDARDKIYGLLGISKANSDRPMMPDYTKSVQQVFTEATVIFVLEHSARPYLDFPFDHINNHLSMSSTPSWVLDFTIYSIPLVHEHSNSCNALYPEKHPVLIDPLGFLNFGRRNLEPVLADQILKSVRFSKDFRTLHTHGVQLATIAFCHPDTSDYGFDSEDLSIYELSALTSLRHFYHRMLKRRGADSYITVGYLPGRDIFLDATETRMFSHGRENYLKSLRGARNTDESSIDEFTTRFTKFVTTKGQLGCTLHPDFSGIRPGDVLVTLFGTKAPFILRLVPGTMTYRMINIALLPGHGTNIVQGREEIHSGWRDFAAEGHPEYAIV